MYRRPPLLRLALHMSQVLVQALANAEDLLSLDEFISVYHKGDELDIELEGERVWPMT